MKICLSLSALFLSAFFVTAPTSYAQSPSENNGGFSVDPAHVLIGAEMMLRQTVIDHPQVITDRIRPWINPTILAEIDLDEEVSELMVYATSAIGCKWTEKPVFGWYSPLHDIWLYVQTDSRLRVLAASLGAGFVDADGESLWWADMMVSEPGVDAAYGNSVNAQVDIFYSIFPDDACASFSELAHVHVDTQAAARIGVIRRDNPSLDEVSRRNLTEGLSRDANLPMDVWHPVLLFPQIGQDIMVFYAARDWPGELMIGIWERSGDSAFLRTHARLNDALEN
jgi:hypothetical protein